jgi:hypothetical protein
MSKFTDQFDTALETITQERGKMYGHPHETFDQIAVLQVMVVECPDPRVRHALEMICVKLVRLCQDPTPANIDNVVDIAGYARTIAMIWDKEYE